MGALATAPFVPGIPMLRSGSKDLGAGEVGVACAPGAAPGDVGVAFMKPNEEPVADGAAVACGDGSPPGDGSAPGDVGPAFMKPNAEPGAAIAEASLVDG